MVAGSDRRPAVLLVSVYDGVDYGALVDSHKWGHIDTLTLWCRLGRQARWVFDRLGYTYPCVPATLRLVRLSRDGYDRAGSYYGVGGAPLYRCEAKDGTYCDLRADSRSDARETLIARWPWLHIRR